jgi:hypothetical protein
MDSMVLNEGGVIGVIEYSGGWTEFKQSTDSWKTLWMNITLSCCFYLIHNSSLLHRGCSVALQPWTGRSCGAVKDARKLTSLLSGLAMRPAVHDLDATPVNACRVEHRTTSRDKFMPETNTFSGLRGSIVEAPGKTKRCPAFEPGCSKGREVLGFCGQAGLQLEGDVDEGKGLVGL